MPIVSILLTHSFHSSHHFEPIFKTLTFYWIFFEKWFWYFSPIDWFKKIFREFMDYGIAWTRTLYRTSWNSNRFPNFWPDKLVMKVAGSNGWWNFKLGKALIFYSVYLFKTYYVSYHFSITYGSIFIDEYKLADYKLNLKSWIHTHNRLTL